jgi:hypothetical protein
MGLSISDSATTILEKNQTQILGRHGPKTWHSSIRQQPRKFAPPSARNQEETLETGVATLQPHWPWDCKAPGGAKQ